MARKRQTSPLTDNCNSDTCAMAEDEFWANLQLVRYILIRYLVIGISVRYPTVHNSFGERYF